MTRLVNVRRFAVVPLVALTVLAACGDDDDPTDTTVTESSSTDLTVTSTTAPGESLSPDGTAIAYHFGDSSVPPQYHRSYTLEVGPTEAHLVVDSYGDELHDVTKKIDAATWEQLVADTSALLGDDVDHESDDGCAGGTSRGLRAYGPDSKDVYLEIDVSLCGDDDEAQELADEIDELVAPVLESFDMDTLLAPSEEE